MPKQIYFVRGMHCASCEVLIEKRMLEMNGVESVNASLAKGFVEFDYTKEKPDVSYLNKIFRENNYTFSETNFAEESHSLSGGAILIALGLIIVFLGLDKLGLTSMVLIGASSPLSAFFFFGLIAGLSSCAALIGGLLLSLSKQWLEKYADKPTLLKKSEPHFLFLAGRLLSYGLFGGVLGFIGAKLQISQGFTSLLIVIVSVVMAILALQMIGVRSLQKFQFTLPKKITTKLASSKNNKIAPFFTGFLTFFLPCGFTVVAQGIAILSGSAIHGGLIMFFFALGTALPLLLIGLSSTKLLSNPKWSNKFVQIAGLLILFFVAYNLNMQFSLTSRLATNDTNTTETTDLKTEKQIIRTTYTTENDIQSSSFTVKNNQPVRFEVDVKDDGFGCMSTIMVPGLYNKSLYLKKGKTLIMEFTPKKTGTYQITCAMGVPRGTLTVTN